MQRLFVREDEVQTEVPQDSAAGCFTRQQKDDQAGNILNTEQLRVCFLPALTMKHKNSYNFYSPLYVVTLA